MARKSKTATQENAAQENGAGTRWTIEVAGRQGQPWLVADPDAPGALERARAWIEQHGIRTLNVAGPSESEVPGIGERAEGFVRALLEPPA